LFVSCIVELSGNPATHEITRISRVREAIPAGPQDQARIGHDRAATLNFTGKAPCSFLLWQRVLAMRCAKFAYQISNIPQKCEKI
jgi:hypothetical protein